MQRNSLVRSWHAVILCHYLVNHTSPVICSSAWNVISVSVSARSFRHRLLPVLDCGCTRSSQWRKNDSGHSGTCFLWTFPFTLMTAAKWQSGQDASPVHKRALKHKHSEMVLLVTCFLLFAEVFDCLYGNNFTAGGKRLNFLTRCPHLTFLWLRKKASLCCGELGIKDGHLTALCYITHHFCLLTRKVPFMFLWVCCNSAEGSSLPVRGLTEVRTIQTLSEPKYNL